MVRVSYHMCALSVLRLRAHGWPRVPCVTRGLGHSLDRLSGETFPQEQVLGQRQNQSQSQGPPAPAASTTPSASSPSPLIPLLPPPQDSLGVFVRGEPLWTVVDFLCRVVVVLRDPPSVRPPPAAPSPPRCPELAGMRVRACVRARATSRHH